VNDIFVSSKIDYTNLSIHIPWAIDSLYCQGVIDNYDLREIVDALRIQQLQSKAWLFNQFKELNPQNKILVIGSWIGFISYCLHKKGFTNVTEIDLDPKHQKLSEWMNREFKNFKHYSENVNNINMDGYDVIICTSCEHLENNEWFYKIKPKTKLFLQSTNLILPDHPNTVNSANELLEIYPLNLSYMGTMIYNINFKRYMITGEKL
jgi:hypothetical protein